MFARIVEFIPKLEQKEEFVKVVRNEVLPILKKQTGYIKVLTALGTRAMASPPPDNGPTLEELLGE